jgi:hypothetical protein
MLMISVVGNQDVDDFSCKVIKMLIMVVVSYQDVDAFGCR